MSKKKSKKAKCLNCGKNIELNDSYAYIYFRNTKKKFFVCSKCWKTTHFEIITKKPYK